MGSASGLYQILLIAYVFSLMGCALIALLISMFYRKKFHQSSPRLGFLASLVLGAVFVLSFVHVPEPLRDIARALQIYLLLACGAAAMFGFLGLHYTLKKVRK
ncbi:MAG: hypothetical protein GF331_16275 [Chitinivibrionales bacterium]|nr:hypothetical protein [Chitinivibrionales bacterium]